MKGAQGCRHRVPAVQICHRYPFWAADRDYIAVRITLPGVVSYDLAIERAAATRKVRGFAANLAVDPVMLLSSATLAHTHEMNETIVEKLKQLELKHEVRAKRPWQAKRKRRRAFLTISCLSGESAACL